MNVPEQPKKKTSPWVWVGCGCGALLIAGAIFVAGIITLVFGSIRSSQPYKDSVARARADARVVEALGTPVETKWWLTGNIQTQNDTGSCDLSIPIYGPKQSATLRVVGQREDRQWRYSEMRVVPKSGEPIDLLE